MLRDWRKGVDPKSKKSKSWPGRLRGPFCLSPAQKSWILPTDPNLHLSDTPRWLTGAGEGPLASVRKYTLLVLEPAALVAQSPSPTLGQVKEAWKIE